MLKAVHDFLFLNKPDSLILPPHSTKPAEKHPDCKVLRWSDGTVYVGQCKGQRMAGKGKLVYPNGQYYQGMFQDNNFHGQGIYFGHDEIYDGDWENGLKHGHGKQQSFEGSSFMGKYENGYKQGFGYFQWSDGSFYQGMFKMDLMHGPGKMTYADGSVLEGQWSQNELSGLGRHTNLDGVTYLGFLEKGIRHGRGLLLEKNRKIQGFWQNGNLIGVASVQQNDGICYNINQQNGVLKLLTDNDFQRLRELQNRNE